MTYEEAVAAITPGLYRHFKGKYYRVLSIARHSETTMEPMVVYQALYGSGGLWVRPADMWNETVERDREEIRRFQPLSRAERVLFFEKIFDEVRSMSHETAAFAEETRMKVRLLDEYYTSGEWQEDYEADEEGLLPADLKRGVLSTHSPILLGLPGAEILSFDDGPIHPCTYEETDSYQVTSMFINNREQILHRLLDE